MFISSTIKEFTENFSLKVSRVAEFFKTLPEYKCPICGGKDFEIVSSDGTYVDVLSTNSVSFSPIPEQPGAFSISTAKGGDSSLFIRTRCKQCCYLCDHDFASLKLKVMSEALEKAVNSNER